MNLQIRGTEPEELLEVTIPSGRRMTIGRSTEADICIPWDARISRIHTFVKRSETGIVFEKHEHAKNPLIYHGEFLDQVELAPGDHLVIGQTSIMVQLDVKLSNSPAASVLHEQTFSAEELAHIDFSDAEKRLEVLSQLPKLLQNSWSDKELYTHVIQLLLAGLVETEAVAIVKINQEGQVEIEAWDRRHEGLGAMHTSRNLIRDALRDKRCTILQIWSPHDTQENVSYTAAQDFDWVVCIPIPEYSEQSFRGVYLAGQFPAEARSFPTSFSPTQGLQGDIKFTELVVQFLASLQKTKAIERQKAGLQQFFSPPILKAIGKDFDTSLLEPRVSEVTVLFCDLKGFSQQVEQHAEDQLEILNRVSRALEVMTHEILNTGGVIGDFHGDAALGFWGWPFSSVNSVVDACRAALAIQSHFNRWSKSEHHPLFGFQVGIGIAHGKGVAGKIGTREHVKVTVFGPVVNLASRLEGMTRQLRVEIALDDQAATTAREKLSKDEGRLRKLAQVKPFGIDHSVVVHELLKPDSFLSDSQIEIYEQGVDQFILGEWEEAYQHIHQMPVTDRASDFLSQIIAQHNRRAPKDWAGVIHLTGK